MNPIGPPEVVGAIGLVVAFVVFAIVLGLAVVVIPHWRMFQRAGYSGALSLLMLLPLVNVIVLLWFAFADWPVLRAGSAEAATLPERRFGR